MSLPPPVFTPVAPPADGLRLAFGAARRRRNGKAAVTGGAGVLVVSFLVSLGGTAGNHTLLQEPLPPARGGVLLLDEPGRSPAPAPTRQPTAAVTSALASVPGAPAAAAGARSARGGTTVTRTRAGSTRTRGGTAGPVSGPMLRDSVITVPGDVMCPVRKRSQGSASLCTDVWPYESQGGISLESTLCSTEAKDIELSYATVKELDVAVISGKREVWRWSVGRQFAASPHTLVLRAGDCFTWRTLWRGVDQQGRPLPAGEYEVRAEFFAAELPSADRVAVSDYRRY